MADTRLVSLLWPRSGYRWLVSMVTALFVVWAWERFAPVYWPAPGTGVLPAVGWLGVWLAVVGALQVVIAAAMWIHRRCSSAGRE